MSAPQTMPPGWYPSPTVYGQQQWWDGQQWGPLAPIPMQVQPQVRQARDQAQYVRQQQGHSVLMHALFGWVLLYIPTIYYAVSPNHYFHT